MHLDIHVAYDTVTHNELLVKLKLWIFLNLWQWFKSYIHYIINIVSKYTIANYSDLLPGIP